MEFETLPNKTQTSLSPICQNTILGVTLGYVIVRFGFTPKLDALGTYASYFFEAGCVLIAAVCARTSLFSQIRLAPRWWAFALLGILSGAGVYTAISALGLIMPFDLSGSETVILLLLVGPVLEELLFRFFLWEGIGRLFRSQKWAWALTTLLFSYSHFHSSWFLPPEIHGFIYYQSIYTIILGLACGFMVFRFSSLTSAIIIHLAFNLGFYLMAVR